MVSVDRADRSKRIADHRSWQLSEDDLTLFPSLRLTLSEEEWFNKTPKDLVAAVRDNEYAGKTFRSKLKCRSFVRGLLYSEPELARESVEKLSTNLNGGDLDKFVFRHIHQIRSNAALQQRVQPTIDHLINTSFIKLRSYVQSGRPDVLDQDFRVFHVLALTIGRLNPGSALSLHQEFSKILGSYQTELGPELILVTLPAVGYSSKEISDGDEKYIEPWRLDVGSPRGWAHGMHTAAYNAPPTIGWDILQNLNSAKNVIEKYKYTIAKSLVGEIYRKCTKDPAANPAWLAARFFKLHQALHAIYGKHPYAQLSRVLSVQVLKISQAAGRAARGSRESFKGKVDLERIAGSVENSLRKRLSRKDIKALHQA